MRRTFPVTVTITGKQSGLYVGTSATVSIIIKQVSNVLTVPALALHTSGSSTYVEKLVNGKKVKTTVTLGETYNSSTVITSGLASGDKVVLTTFRLADRVHDRVGQPRWLRRQRGRLPGGRAVAAAARPEAASRPAGPGGDAVSLIELAGVRKTYDTGHIEVDALRGVDVAHRRGRVRRDHRPVRVGQVHADAHPRLPGRADRAAATTWPARTSPR